MKWLRPARSHTPPTREVSCPVPDSPSLPPTMLDLAPLAPPHALSRALTAGLEPLDRLLDRVYTSQWNPLYQSGALALFLLAIVLLSGLYLLFFYRVSAPYASVMALHQQFFLGRWIRALHRYASDTAMIAIAFHLLRLIAQGRTWGPRTLAWVSGVLLTGAILLSGWTGQIMVWDVQAQLLASAGAQLFDLLPIFSEPVSRAFVSNEALPRSFFFLNLFIHITMPLGGGLLLWIHISRVARPRLFPPRPLAWGMLIVLGLFAIVWPPAMLAEADLSRLPGAFAIDWFLSFWLLLARLLPATGQALFWVILGGALLSVPWWLRPGRAQRPAPSYDNVALCQGCDQCWQDCPFEAIQMLPRPEPRGRASERMAVVDAERCVSCGLCAGSCAPMAIGPPGRTGRAQLHNLPTWFRPQEQPPGRVVLLVCRHNAMQDHPRLRGRTDITLQSIDCPGALHTSVLEHLVRLGAPGVCILSCPDRNCRHREGPKWLFERVYHDREAELSRRVERRQICLINGASGEQRRIIQELDAFCARVRGLPAAQDVALTPWSSWRTLVRQYVPRLLLAGVFLALLSLGNRLPLGQPGSDGVLRLAWRLPGASSQSCRDLTAEELASKPLHMRQQRECTAQPITYRLLVTIDGVTRLDRSLVPVGARGDRPLYVQQDFYLEAGLYPVTIAFQPLLSETARQASQAEDHRQLQLRTLALQQQVQIVPDRITLITTDARGEVLEVMTPEP